MNLVNVTNGYNRHKISLMSKFGQTFKAWRESKGVTGWMLEKYVGVKDFRMTISNIENGRRNPSDGFLEKIAGVPELSISLETLKGWRAADEYSKEALLEALNALSEEDLKEVKARADKERRG